MSTKSKPTTGTNWKLEWDSEDDYETSVRVVDARSERPAPTPRPANAPYWWQDPNRYWEPRLLWSCMEITEPTCCGFPVLGEFCSEDRKLLKAIAEDVGKALTEKLLTKGRRKYWAAYLPDTKEYEIDKKILVAAGFKPEVSLTSKHGRYTNTRWGWFHPSYKGKHEKAVLTYPV